MKNSLDYAALTWQYCSSCQPDSKEHCKKCWSEWNIAPSLNRPDVTYGHWIEHIDSYENYCECSVCHYIPDAPLDETNYCPNCGAKMDRGEEDEAD